jgi:hypothetical protein
VPVYNVAMPLLARTNPDRPPYLIVEVPQDPDMPAQAPQAQRGEPMVKSA